MANPDDETRRYTLEELNPLNYVKKTPSGASLAAYDANPRRKKPGVPNEDSNDSRSITLDPGADPAQQLHRVVQHVTDRYNSRNDASTLSAALISDGKLYTSNIGDSPVLVITYDLTEKGEPVKVTQVTRDHVVSDPEERKGLPVSQVDNCGGTCWRVFDAEQKHGLLTSRMGGAAGFPVNRQVEDKSYDLDADLKAGRKVFVVAASDGLMENNSVNGIKNMLNLTFKEKLVASENIPAADELAHQLAQYRFDSFNSEVIHARRNDDTTVLVQPVTASEQAPAGAKKNAILLTVADGTGYKSSYEKQLSDIFTEEVPRFMQNPHLIRDTTMSRDPVS